MRPARRAQLALLVEVAATPKPGNVDRCRDHDDLRFEHFLAGAVGAADGLEDAADGGPIGAAFERSVAGMSEQEGGNTQFGGLLLLVPLVRAAAEGDLTPEGASAVVEATTVDDAAAFYRAFEHVDVGAGEPPDDVADLDVRRGADAVPAVEERGITLYELMEESAGRDGIAREWVSEFERSFDAADRLASREGPAPDRAARVFLELLAGEPDTHVAKRRGEDAARETSARARATLEGDLDPDDLADALVAEGINPGTTADILAAGLFVSLSRGGVRV